MNGRDKDFGGGLELENTRIFDHLFVFFSVVVTLHVFLNHDYFIDVFFEVDLFHESILFDGEQVALNETFK
jgi:hypothetical protein